MNPLNGELDESLAICIHMVCRQYGIENYTINEDGSIDVDGNVDLSGKGLTELPLQFRNVTGSFYCYNNKLPTLEGAPQKVGKDFYCDDNPDLSEKEIKEYRKRIGK